MAKLEAKIAVSDSAPSDVFEKGKYEVTTITVKSSNASKPPTELLIVAPVFKGTYPVLLFCHGFMIPNTNYTTLLSHIASHGYIVVAPKFYGLFGWLSMDEEIIKAARVTQWLSTGLPLVLPEKVNGVIEKLALSGHSRGGKTAFALALGKFDQNSRKNKPPARFNSATAPKFKAIIGVDPVAGPRHIIAAGPQDPPIHPSLFQHVDPRGGDWVRLWQPAIGSDSALRPDGVNHSEFFNESKPPVCYFLAKDYGHCDMLDDNLDLMGRLASAMCKSGKGPKDLMRRSIGGVVVAFLESYLSGDGVDLNAIVEDPSIAPTTLDRFFLLRNERGNGIVLKYGVVPFDYNNNSMRVLYHIIIRQALCTLDKNERMLRSR